MFVRFKIFKQILKDLSRTYKRHIYWAIISYSIWVIYNWNFQWLNSANIFVWFFLYIVKKSEYTFFISLVDKIIYFIMKNFVFLDINDNFTIFSLKSSFKAYNYFIHFWKILYRLCSIIKLLKQPNRATYRIIRIRPIW